MAVFFSALFLILAHSSLAGATEFADADSITLQTRTTYFVNFVFEGQQGELELNAAQYQLLIKLQKLSLGQTLTDSMDDDLAELVSSINGAAVKSFGKSLVVKSENGYHFYRSVSTSANLLFQVSKRGVFYRGQEVVLTEKQTEVVRVLDQARGQSMTFEELAQTVGWNGRNYRTNVRSYMDAINSKSLEFAGVELLQVEGRGKSIRINVREPATYSEAGYSRVNGRIVHLEASAFAVAEIIAESIREKIPTPELTISAPELRKINLTPSQILASLRAIYAAAGVSPGLDQRRVKVVFPAGENAIQFALDGSSKKRVPTNRGRGGGDCSVLL